MKIFYVFFLLIVFPTIAYSQAIQGKVVDEKTGVGIPFMSIGIVGAQNSTITNENGDFVLKIEVYPAKIKFSHVSYLAEELILSNNKAELIIKAKPATINLQEITINPIKAEILLKTALKKVKDNANTTFYGAAFYRQLTSLDEKASEIYELFYDLKWNTKGVKGWSAKQSRFAQSVKNIPFSVSNQSFLTFTFSGSLLPEEEGKFINLWNFKDFDIKIERYIEQGDQNIAVITCNVKNQKGKEFFANSIYYIGTKNLNIYRIENNIYNMPVHFPGVVLRFPPAITTVTTFKNKESEPPTLESISTKLNLVIKNGKEVFNFSTNSLLTIYKIDERLKSQRFEALNTQTKDKTVVQSIKYDAEFWKDNPIVKQTTLEDSFIKMMESKSAFGTMTNP